MRRPLRQLDRAQHSSLNELNITPLLDLVFVLLVIFIIVTPQMTNNLQLSLPSAKAAPPEISDAKPDDIVVTDEGKILFNEETVTIDQLKTLLAQRKTAFPTKGVTVSGTRDANYQAVIDVLDVIQQLGIGKVGLTTTIAEKPQLQ